MKKLKGYFTLSLLMLLSMSSGNSAPQSPGQGSDGQTGTRERLALGNGAVTLDIDLGRLNGNASAAEESKLETFRFEVGPNSLFTIRVFNDSLRGPEPGSIGLIWKNSSMLPEPLIASSHQLVLEKTPSGEQFDLQLRDGTTGFVFFNVDGDLYEYDAATRSLRIDGGRLLVSEELAKKLGRPADAGSIVGKISISASVYPLEITSFVNGAAQSSVLPAHKGGNATTPEFVPGPDIIVGDMSGLFQAGSAGTQVGLGIGATSCNNGDQPVHFYQMPNPDHSTVSQNFYRMSGGPNNNDRFEQLGFAWVKHTFGADQENACSLGCTPFPNQTELGVGCSDPYLASQNAFQGNTNSGALGSRAWINPFTGAFPSESQAGAAYRPRSYRHIAPGSRGSERPEHHAQSGRDVLHGGAIRLSSGVRLVHGASWAMQHV